MTDKYLSENEDRECDGAASVKLFTSVWGDREDSAEIGTRKVNRKYFYANANNRLEISLDALRRWWEVSDAAFNRPKK